MHQRPDGFQISVSKTIGAPSESVFKAWKDHRHRARWLAEEALSIRKATPGKSIRITWKDGKTSVEVSILSKGVDKSQMVVQHSKLPNAKSAAAMKRYWSDAALRLKTLLEA
ncbi:MAG: hypothetical protein HY650_03070 [Acidobacteria bacterium]|nr:hypothetical protein [Acidobacteriota bacterium]